MKIVLKVIYSFTLCTNSTLKDVFIIHTAFWSIETLFFSHIFKINL